MWRPSGEQVAAQCRSELNETLQLVHQRTIESTSPAGQLFLRMNAVLSAAVDSNFGCGCTDSLDVLYRSIGRLQPEMALSRGDDLTTTLFFFARSFATVLEEAVRQRREAMVTVSRTSSYTQQTEIDWTEAVKATVSLPPPYAAVAAGISWSSLKSSSKELLVLRKETKHPATTTVPPPISIPAPAAVVKVQQQSPPVTVAAPAALLGSEQSRTKTQKVKVLDYSPKALEGRLAIHNLPDDMSALDVRKLLLPYGRIVEFSLPRTRSVNGDYYALAKLESNEAASRAAAALHGRAIEGATLEAKRLQYVSKYRKPKSKRPMATVSPPPPSCFAIAAARLSSSSETPNEDQLVAEEKELEEEEKEKEETKCRSTAPAATVIPPSIATAQHQPLPTVSSATTAKASWSSETPNEDQLVAGERESREEEARHASTAVPSMSAAVSATATMKMTMTVMQRPPPPTASRAAANRVGTESWKRHLERQYPHKILDFSPEAIEGRLSIYNLPCNSYESVVRSVLEKFGRIVEFFLSKPVSQKVDRYALVKLESNRAANAAVASLNGRLVDGTRRLEAKRLRYLSNYRDARPNQLPRMPMPLHQRLLQPVFNCGGRGADDVDVEAAPEVDSDVSSPEVDVGGREGNDGSATREVEDPDDPATTSKLDSDDEIPVFSEARTAREMMLDKVYEGDDDSESSIFSID